MVGQQHVHLVSNCISIEPIGTIYQWCNKSKVVKAVSCPKIVSTYNESMGSVDLADMLIVLYRIDVKTRHWYIKVFWQFVDVAKVNAWILYKRHYKQLALSANKRKSLVEFTSSIVSALILAGKSKPNSFRRWPTKWVSIEPTWNGGKKTTLLIPIDDVRHDEVGHWPKPGTDKKRCWLCQNYSRISCSNCNVYLYLIANCNCNVHFHSK